MRSVELKLVSELMRNSRRSDRELAKAIGVSQPTISRMVRKLKDEGIIKEYTIIPDFTKLGYNLMAFTFAKLHRIPAAQTLEEAVKTAEERLRELQQVIMLERGIGLSSNGVIVSFHKDYSSFVKQREWLKQFSFLGEYELETFMIDLNDPIHYRNLTFQTLAKDLLTVGMKEEKPTRKRQRKRNTQTQQDKTNNKAQIATLQPIQLKFQNKTKA